MINALFQHPYIAIIVSIFSYLGATLVLWTPSRVNALVKVFLPLLAILSQGLYLYLAIETGVGQNLSADNIFCLMTWLMAIMMLPFGVPTLGVLIYPLCIFSLLLPLGIHESHVIQTKLDMGILLHIAISIMALSVLAFSAVQALLYAIQDRLLKRRQMSFSVLLNKIAPLQSMETLLFRLLIIGTILLSASILTGILFIKGLFDWQYLPKTLFTFVAWAYFGGLVAGHHFWGWRGKKAVHWTWVGTIFLVIGYYGTKLILKI